MNILFVHQNFPGQYVHVAPALARRGHRVVGIHQAGNGLDLAGVERHGYTLIRGNTPGIHPLAQEFESKIIRAEACAQIAIRLRDQGFQPEVIHAHPAWGEALYLKDVFPDAKLINYAEFYYRSHGQDMNFDPEFPAQDFTAFARLHTKNTNLCMALNAMDCGVSPTHWQAQTHPTWAQHKIQVIHDGINTDVAKPNPMARIDLPDRQVTITPGDEVLTFVARNLEPVRGYHSFMRALPEVLRRRPKVKVFIVGGDGTSYGSPPPTGSYRQQYLQEVAEQLDPQRVFLMGKISYAVYLQLLQISRCHVYLTYPFVLSWSMLEAMSSGALVVGSRTPPVEEFITHGDNGLLVDFFAIQDMADTLCAALEDGNPFAQQRQKARQTIVEHYDLHRHCLPQQIKLTEQP